MWKQSKCSSTDKQIKKMRFIYTMEYCCCCCCLVASVMSDSVRLYGLQPARLVCPWNSPGKNSGVDCHSLLQRIILNHGSNLGLLHCRWILCHLSQQGSQLVRWVGYKSYIPVVFLYTNNWKYNTAKQQQSPMKLDTMILGIFFHMFIYKCTGDMWRKKYIKLSFFNNLFVSQ